MTEQAGFKGWRVPPLGGWVSWAYAGLWWLLLGAALAATVAAALDSEWDGPYRVPLLRAGINYTRDAAILVRDGAGWAPGASTGVPAEQVAAWLADAPLTEDAEAATVVRGDPLFPLRVPLIARPAGEPEAIAWLLVGSRPDGTVQDRDARAVLAEIARALGRALHVIAARRRRFAAFFPEIAPATPPRRAVRSRSQRDRT